MLRMFVVCSLLAAFFSLSTSSPINLKIYGGKATVPNRYPWQALIVTQKIDNPRQYFLCGGVLVHPKWVLTATQCIKNYRKVTVLFGVWNTTNIKEKNRRSHGASSVVENPCADSSVFSGANLAMIKLKGREPRRNVVCLPQHPDRDWREMEMGVQLNDCIATGYGAVDSNRLKPATLLQEAVFTGISKTACAGHFRDRVASDKICGHGPNKETDTCYGDMGGPLLCSQKYRRPGPTCSSGFYLTGITSSGGATCGTPKQPAVFTAVFPYTTWIRGVMGDKKVEGVTSILCQVSGGGGLKSKNITDPFSPPYVEVEEDGDE